MKIYYFIILGVVASVLGGFLVFAQEDDPFADITYPIPELGDCADKEDCLNYCDDPENMGTCLNFAEEHSLMPEEDIEIGKKMLAAGEIDGPGGCRGASECGEYCDDISHIRECVAFAEKHDLMPEDELEEAKKVADALDRGIQPPPCNSKSECDDICTQPENMKTCITFAREAGLLPPEELEEVEKVLAALEKGITPPPCGNKDDCDEYCAMPENFETCINFAEAAGFMSPEEASMIRRTGGQGPGGCRGKEACESYCEDPANMEPCIDFAIENGFMSPEEAEQAKKMIAAGFTSGPGGCRGAEECEGYCDDVSHISECVDFAEKTGMMSQEDAVRARKMAELGMAGGPGGCNSEEECRGFCDDPANLDTCLDFAIQIGDITPEEAEQAKLGMQMKAKMTECVALPCSEALECLQSLSSDGGGGTMEAPEGEAGGENDEVQAKIESCMAEMMPEGFERPEGFEFEGEEFQEQFEEQFKQQMERQPMQPPGSVMPPEGEFQRQFEQQVQQEIQHQIEQQMQEQIQQQMQQFAPSPTEMMAPPPTTEQPPQSFFETAKNFLASLLPIF